MEKVINVAHYICEEYCKLSGERIDTMKLHKLLYFAQRENIAITGQPLFEDIFEGWKYGPVCVAIRNNFDKGKIINTDVEPISQQSAYIVKNVILQYGELESCKLSQISHSEISWINSRKGLKPGENGCIPLLLSDIEKDAEKVRPYDSIWDMYLDEFEDYEEEQ